MEPMEPTGPNLGRAARRNRGPLNGNTQQLSVVRSLLALAIASCSLLILGWELSPLVVEVVHFAQLGMLLVYGILLLIERTPRGRRLGRQWLIAAATSPQCIITVLGLMLGWWPAAMQIAGALLVLSHVMGWYFWLLQRGVNPGIIFVGSFAALVLVGTAGLMMPQATPADRPISFVDALFTSTSATCVTGLVVRDTGQDFTRFGQIVILILIQLGGLGTLLFGALVALLLGSSLSLKAVHALADTAAGTRANEGSIRRLVLFAGAVVFGIEAIGAAMLYYGWPSVWDRAPADIGTTTGRLFHSVFFSVSAFCNAGFATTPNSVESLRIHWTTHIVIAGLALIGGLGLPVYANVAQIVRARILRRPMHAGSLVRFTLHTRMVLTVTLVTYLIGLVLIFISQLVQRDVPFGTALLDAHFMSVATRTAGFDSTTPAGMGPLARFVLMVTMFIGGAPASAAGGIKVIVFGILVLMAWSAIMNRDSVQAFGRTITPEVQRRAAALFMIHLILVLVIAGVLVVTETEHQPANPGTDIGVFEELVFESISGCSTVGMSLGPTAGLSNPGKIAVTIGMFLGRVGALAFLVTLAAMVRRGRARYTYPAEGVVLT